MAQDPSGKSKCVTKCKGNLKSDSSTLQFKLDKCLSKTNNYYAFCQHKEDKAQSNACQANMCRMCCTDAVTMFDIEFSKGELAKCFAQCNKGNSLTRIHEIVNNGKH